MNDITALMQRLVLAAAKGCCQTLLPDDCRALVEALEKAQNTAAQQGNIASALLDEVTQLRRYADDKAPELREQLNEAYERIAELESREPDLYLCRMKGGEELYSPCGKDYPRGRGYYTKPPSSTVKLPAYPESSDSLMRASMKAVRTMDVEALRAAGIQVIEGEQKNG